MVWLVIGALVLLAVWSVEKKKQNVKEGKEITGDSKGEKVAHEVAMVVLVCITVPALLYLFAVGFK